MIVIGPALNTGIGHHAQKYTRLFQPDSTYHIFGSELPESEHGLVFTLPIKPVSSSLPLHVVQNVSKIS